MGKRATIIVGSLLLITAGLVLFAPTRFLARGAPAADEIAISKGSMNLTVTCSGTIKANSVQNYGGPAAFDDYWQWQIVGLVPDGNQVKKGDILVTFDNQKISQDLHQFQNDLEQATKEMEKTKVQIESEESDLNARLAEAENKYATLKLKQA
ncbi:MAG: hypothetical protein ACREAC_10385, partial [Blastocatellia bacterium]